MGNRGMGKAKRGATAPQRSGTLGSEATFYLTISDKMTENLFICAEKKLYLGMR